MPATTYIEMYQGTCHSTMRGLGSIFIASSIGAFKIAPNIEMSITVNTAPATNPPITMLSPRFIVPVSIIPLADKIVSEKFDYGAGRRVTLYVPPDLPETIVFAGDGQMISQWGVRPAARTLSQILVFHRVVES